MLSILTARLMHLGKLERDTPKCHVFEASTSHHTVSNCLMLRLAGTAQGPEQDIEYKFNKTLRYLDNRTTP